MATFDSLENWERLADGEARRRLETTVTELLWAVQWLRDGFDSAEDESYADSTRSALRRIDAVIALATGSGGDGEGES